MADTILCVLSTMQLIATVLFYTAVRDLTAAMKAANGVKTGPPAAADDVKAGEASERDVFSEGFQNLMTYSVRGKTGFEGPGSREVDHNDAFMAPADYSAAWTMDGAEV